MKTREEKKIQEKGNENKRRKIKTREETRRQEK